MVRRNVSTDEMGMRTRQRMPLEESLWEAAWGVWMGHMMQRGHDDRAMFWRREHFRHAYGVLRQMFDSR